MARVTLYVTDDLKARMAETGDALNWSEIARPAFETAIANYKHRQERSMTTLIERLRASKVNNAQEDEADAKEQGRAWATDDAEFSELKRIAEIDVTCYGNGVSHIWQAIKAAIDPKDELQNRDIVKQIFGDNYTDDEDWTIAWVEGAQEVFAEVEGQI